MDVTNQHSAQPKVSVIVPAYNAAEYLAECLQSLANQTMGDFEAIVVDDASTDSTPDIVRQFASEDSRFRLLTVEHGGVSKARNAGIDMAKGEYICFVDADDCCLPTMFERMLGMLCINKAKICICSYFKGTGFVPDTSQTNAQSEIFSYNDALKAALYQIIILNNAWGALFSKDIIGEKRFRNNIRYEDLDSFYRFFEGAERIVYLPEQLYFYRQHPSSFLHRYTPERLDVLDVTDRLLDYMSQHHPSLVRAAADRRFSAHFNILMLLLANGIDDRASERRCLDVIKEYRMAELTDRNVRLKNKCGALASFLGRPLLRLLAGIYK